MSRSDGNTRSAPCSARERADATPAPLSYNLSKAPKTAVLLVAPRAAHALDLRVQAGFLGPYVSLKPTWPPYEHQQVHLVVYRKEESALVAHDFKYGDAAFAPLHRSLPALEKILPAQDPDMAEHEQPIVQRLQAGPAKGSTAFISQLVCALRERPATGLTERISEWNAAPDHTDAAAPTAGPSRNEEMSETIVQLLAPLEGEATTLLPTNHDAPTPAPEIQIDPRLPAGLYYGPDVFSESQEETVKKRSSTTTHWKNITGAPSSTSVKQALATLAPRPLSRKSFPPSSKHTMPRWNGWASRTLPLTKSLAQCISREKALATTRTTPY